MFLLEVCHSYSQLTSPNDAATLQCSSQISMKPNCLSQPTAAAAPYYHGHKGIIEQLQSNTSSAAVVTVSLTLLLMLVWISM